VGILEQTVHNQNYINSTLFTPLGRQGEESGRNINTNSVTVNLDVSPPQNTKNAIDSSVHTLKHMLHLGRQMNHLSGQKKCLQFLETCIITLKNKHNS
jgi:hypothetical protein